MKVAAGFVLSECFYLEILDYQPTTAGLTQKFGPTVIVVVKV
jgi:hypothetical protein